MSLAYDEIIIKYVEGGILKNLSWLLQQLEKDPEIVAGSCREKDNLKKFLTSVNDQFDDFLGDGDDNRGQQEDKELFGDDDIVVGGRDGTQTDFMEPPNPDDPQDDTDNPDSGSDFDVGHDFDDGFPK